MTRSERDDDRQGVPCEDAKFPGPLDQESFQALLFNSFLHQQERVRERRWRSDPLAGIVAIYRDLAERPRPLDDILNLVAMRTLEMTGASGAAIALTTRGEMVCRAIAGSSTPALGTRLALDSGLSAECVRTARLLRCEDTETDPRVNREACRALGVASMILVPIHQRGIKGIFELLSSRRDLFDATDEHILQLMALIITATLSEQAEIEARQALANERDELLTVIGQLTPALETLLSSQAQPQKPARAAAAVASAVIAGGAAKSAHPGVRELVQTLGAHGMWKRDDEERTSN